MEFWDIYDSDKKQTGRTMKRNDWNLKNGEYHLTVLGVIHRPDGRFLITRRVMTKAWAPGWWEVSGGGVMAGEDSIDAVKVLQYYANSLVKITQPAIDKNAADINEDGIVDSKDAVSILVEYANSMVK